MASIIAEAKHLAYLSLSLPGEMEFRSQTFQHLRLDLLSLANASLTSGNLFNIMLPSQHSLKVLRLKNLCLIDDEVR